MNQKTTIQIFCSINQSEDTEKVKLAVNNIFPDIDLEISETEINGKTNNFSSLSLISKSIHENTISNNWRSISCRRNFILA